MTKDIFTALMLITFLGACSSRNKPALEPVLLRFVPEQELGIVVHPVDWFRSAEQDNPGVDCTLKLETQGPPDNVYSCVVKDARNVFIVKIFESYLGDLEERHLAKITIDSKWAATRDLWIEALKKSSFKSARTNPEGAKGSKWEFASPDGGSIVEIYWNQKSKAVSVRITPKATGRAE